MRLPDLARRLVRRTAELTASRGGMLAVFQEGRWQVAALQKGESSTETSQGLAVSASSGSSLERALGKALSDFMNVTSDVLADEKQSEGVRHAMAQLSPGSKYLNYTIRASQDGDI